MFFSDEKADVEINNIVEINKYFNLDKLENIKKKRY